MRRFGPQIGARIAGTGVAFPGAAQSNAEAWEQLLGPGWRSELEARGWDADRPETEWGIRTRHRGGQAIDLAVRAAREAIGDRAIDVLIVATSTPTSISASMAGKVAAALDSSAPALDIRAGGAAALYGWLDALGWLARGARAACVVAVETPSAFVEPGDISMALLYGDAAAAVLLEPSDSGGLVAAVAGSRAPTGRPFTIPGPLPPTPAGRYAFQSPDPEYSAQMTACWDELSEALADAATEAIDAYLPYAVTRKQVERSARIVGARRVVHDLAARGCNGCAGPLVALHLLERPAGMLALAAAGGGIGMAGLLWKD